MNFNCLLIYFTCCFCRLLQGKPLQVLFSQELLWQLLECVSLLSPRNIIGLRYQYQLFKVFLFLVTETLLDLFNRPHSKMTTIFNILLFVFKLAFLTLSYSHAPNSKEYFTLHEARRTNLNAANKRILKWRLFWDKIHGNKIITISPFERDLITS